MSRTSGELRAELGRKMCWIVGWSDRHRYGLVSPPARTSASDFPRDSLQAPSGSAVEDHGDRDRKAKDRSDLCGNSEDESPAL